MRYGCCVNMVTKTADVSGLDVLGDIKRVGFDYVELSLAHLCAMSDARLNVLIEHLDELDLSAEACNNFFPPSLPLTGAAVNRDLVKAYIERAFAIAARLGVRSIVFGSGGARMVPGNFPVDAAFEQLVQWLRAINMHAKDHGIRIAIEPLRKAECNIINTYGEATSLAKAVNESNVGCLVDYYHLVEEKEDVSALVEGKQFLFHAHLAYPEGRVYPRADQSGEFIELFRSLKNAGYTGRMSLEAYANDFPVEAHEALNMIRSIESLVG
jgi:D-psicose/D-tagatose/L-ribulose 3-epimerase